MDLHSSSVPFGEHVKRQSTVTRPGPFHKAAGKGTKELSSSALKTGYAWGDVVKAQSHVKNAFEGAAGAGTVHVDLHLMYGKKAFQGAAGVGTTHQDEHQHKAKKVSSANYHRGLSRSMTSPHGVYDYHPSAQGHKARSVPKRKSQIEGVIKGTCQKATKEHAEAFRGGYDHAYQGAAGVAGGHWADARYASTTAWN